MKKIIPSVLLWLLISLLSATVLAAMTAEELVNDAYRDGSLIATASTCGVNQADVNRFANQQEANALSIAKNNQLIFDADNYNDYVTAGFESTMQLLASMAVDDANYQKNCADATQKLKKKLTEN